MADDSPTIHEEGRAWNRRTLERERAQTRLLIILTVTLLPAWIPFDFVLEPHAALRILVFRLTDTAVGFGCYAALARVRNLVQVRAIAIVKVVCTGVAIALMLPLVEHHFWPYVLGFSLLFWGSAVVLAMPVGLMAGAWGVVLVVAVVGVVTGPVERSPQQLIGATFYIASMFIICVAQVALRVRLERQAFISAHRLEEANHRLVESEALKSEFFANVSHELRTPLALILGPTDELLASDRITEDQRARLTAIARNANLLLGHVNDLLDVTRLELGQLRIHYARIDLARLVRTVGRDFEGTASFRGVELRIEAPDSLPCDADPEKVQAILLNLLSNAFKVTTRGDRIRCSLRELGPGSDAPARGRRAVLEVADSGPGIAPEHRGLVFERFRQIEGGANRTLGGTGLGLAITRDLVELHGGRIEVGEAPEGGASFRVELPLRAPREAPVEPSNWQETEASLDLNRQALAALEEEELPPDDTAGEAPVVLVVEDNPTLNRFVRESLSPTYRTASALDGQSGLDKALALTPDLIVTDVMMPGMSGEQLVQAARARPELENVPILVLSARADERLRVRLLREGAQDYVTKPFSADELRARVTNLVATARARRLLQAELESTEHDVEVLAREVTQKRRELVTAVESARLARDVAERASDIKTRFLRVVSHELRSPLTTLLLALRRLRDGARPDDATTPVLARMDRAATRLSQLVESLLEYARVESGNLMLEVKRFDLVQLAENAVEELMPQAEAKDLDIELEPGDGEPPPLSSDARLVHLIAVNLIGNAIKYTSEGGVFVTVSWERGVHRLAVRDTGPGIDPAQRGHIFEPFEQVEPTRDKHTAGVGLGLALVREMVQALGGNIELQSEPGQGSTFTVELPPLAANRPSDPPS